MKAKAYFLDPKRVKVETSTGEVFILGFISDMNYQIASKVKWSFTDDLIAPLFDKYYDGNPDVIMGIMNQKLLKNSCNMIYWVEEDRDKERVRIGTRIKQLRQEKNMEAKELAQMVGIDAANLCRIEQGRYSVGMDILCKIAGVLGMKLDFVEK